MNSTSLYWVIRVVFALLSCLAIYGRIKASLKPNNDRKLIFTIIIGFLLLVAIANFIIAHVAEEPVFFKAAVDQLHSNSMVAEKISPFSSYGFNPDSLPKKPGKYATFNVRLIGDSLTIYVTCTMKRNNQKWQLINVKQDTIVKNN